jgi:hypothetical protein
MNARSQTKRPPASRQGLNHHRVRVAERGKPVTPPETGKASRKASRRSGGYGIAEKANAGL